MGQFIRNKTSLGDLLAKKLKKKTKNKGLDQTVADNLRGLFKDYSVTDKK